MSRDPFSSWNRSASTDFRGSDARDASNRIFDGYFTPQNLPDAPTSLSKSDIVFTMGSCFAREIEAELRRRRFTIGSMDRSKLQVGELWGEWQETQNFFHRYNLPAMELEIARALDDSTFNESQDLLVDTRSGILDLNYGPYSLPRLDHAGALRRRQISREMVANVTTSKWIVLTLGLTEAWLHKPSGFVCNGVAGDVLARFKNDFEFHVFSFEENLRALEHIFDCLKKKHSTGDFTFVVTVSPVPLRNTFSGEDIVLANSRSKSVLRAVADDFCARHEKAIYFPSYEIAMHSNRDLVWRPDRAHINRECVAHIMSVFIDRYVDVNWKERLVGLAKRAVS